MIVENAKGIAWDLDGTLIDSFGIFEEVLLECVEGSAYPLPTQEMMRHNYHGSLNETIGNILGISPGAELDIVVGSFLAKQERHYGDNLDTHLFPDAAKLAQRAAKLAIPQSLITNRSHEGRGTASPHHIVANTVLTSCIQNVYAGDEVTHRKPDRRCLDAWLEEKQISPEGLIVIGDQFVDAQLALNLGARALLVERGNPIPHMDELAGHPGITVVSSLDDITFA